MPRPTDDVDLDAGFLDRAHGAGVVRAVGARAGEQQRPFVVLESTRLGFRTLVVMVTSFSISNFAVPFGVETVTSSPSSLLRMARPIGDEVEISPSRFGVFGHHELVDSSPDPSRES
jgi:hypothetical protein